MIQEIDDMSAVTTAKQKYVSLAGKPDSLVESGVPENRKKSEKERLEQMKAAREAELRELEAFKTIHINEPLQAFKKRMTATKIWHLGLSEPHEVDT
jgi:hypothetical protein